MTTRRQRITIPSDWSDDWACVEIQWPDSPEWLAILRALILSPIFGRFWDEKTGSVRSAQSVGFEIEEKNIPLVACNGREVEDGGSAGCVPFGAIIMESEDMGQVVTDVQIVDGKIRVFFGPCCWHDLDVSGALEDQLLPPPPGDDVPDFPALETGTACSKVSRWCSVLFAAVDSLADDSAAPELPNVALNNLHDLRPRVNWGDANALAAYANIMNPRSFGLLGALEDPDIQQTIKCRLVSLVADGNQGITKDEYNAMVTDIVRYLQQEFTIVRYPTSHAEMVNVYYNLALAFGAGDTEKITAGTAPSVSDDCSCPSGESDLWDDWGTDWLIVWDLRGQQPIETTLSMSNGTTVIRSDGMTILENDSGSETAAIERLTTGSGFTLTHAYCEVDVASGFVIDAPGMFGTPFGSYIHDWLEGSRPELSFLRTDLSETDFAKLEIGWQSNWDDTKTPPFPVIKRLIVGGTGNHPFGE